jgi:hypothetical protein
MARISAILATLAVLSGCASELLLEQDGALAIVPRQFGDSGHIVVEVMLNGHGPFDFALDTGASISAVFDKARAESSIEAVPGRDVYIFGMTGAGTFPITNIDRITFGQEEWLGARVALLPDDEQFAKSIDGILGVDFLSRYAIYYAQQERTVRLYPRELVAERAYHGWNSVPLYDLRVGNTDITMLAFDLKIGIDRIPALFDLGATVNIMNRRAARLLHVPVQRARDVQEVWGVTGFTGGLTEVIVRQLRIREMHWWNRRFVVGDFPVFEVLGTSGQPLAIAGSNLFREHDFIVDFERKRLLIKSR